MLTHAPVRDVREVSVAGSATLLRWSHDASAVEADTDLSKTLSFYALMAKKYDSMRPLDHHDHERPHEANPF